MICDRCGFENPEGMRYCGQCASPLAPAPTAGEPARAEAERRLITVLFCDLVGSTSLSERLDPEELHEVVRLYQNSCVGVIERFSGYVAQYLGDGLLVYFGYPRAHEDDAQRAVRAGLGILGELERLSRQTETSRGIRFAARVGVHTGLVVVGELGSGERRERLALGSPPNVADRLQKLADPGSVVISGATYRQVAGFFVCQPLGEKRLRGVSVPLAVHRVLAESGVADRLEVAARTGLTPLVGREAELDLLERRWRSAVAGRGGAVLIRGEAGIGKSRLVQAMRERLAGELGNRQEWRCSPYFSNTALFPLLEWLQRHLGFDGASTLAQKRGRLQRLLEEAALPVERHLPLWGSLLSLGTEGVEELSPRQRKQATFDSVLAWLERLAASRPLLLVVQNIHWVDPSTLELLDRVVERSRDLPLLVLLAFRPDFEPHWATGGQVDELTLGRLSRSDAALMVESVAGGRVLPGEVREQLVERSDGIPLFVEEMTKMVVELGQGAAAERGAGAGNGAPAVPETLQSSLMARLDRMGAAKGVAQLCSTLGRNVSLDVLHQVSPWPAAALERELDRLVAAELLLPRPGTASPSYTFKHALIQETAYASLLKVTRQDYHRRIGEVLERGGTDLRPAVPELVAHHFTEAGLPARAVPFWRQAGQRALKRSANLEASHHLGRARDLLAELPPSAQRDGLELEIQTLLGPALMATRGFGAPEVAEVYRRARELCQGLGDTPQLFPVLLGLFRFYGMRAEWRTARELGEQLLALARQADDPALLPEAHRAQGAILYHTGDMTRAGEHLERGIELYEAHAVTASKLQYAHHSGVNCRTYAALAQAYLGYPDRAVVQHRQAVDLARRISHPLTLAFAVGAAATLHEIRGEVALARQRAEEAVEISEQHGFPTTLAIGRIFLGWAMAEQRQAAEGVEMIREGLAAWEAEGAIATRTLFLSLLARALELAARTAEAQSVLREALALAELNGERFHLAELHRFRGELLLGQDPEHHEAAQECFQRGLEVATEQRARLLELRVASSLAALWASCGRRRAAIDLLEPRYRWFSEGFGTSTLERARRLLAELA